MIGLVGHSGAGKSTYINLVMKLYNPDSGKILVDEQDLSNYSDADYKEILGVVLQESYLFSGSIYENILYGKPDATREEVIEAAKLAGAHEFISALEDGYDTYVGERGVKLSGGQKQRISIARVFLKNPSVLILDEATSALDNESERMVQKSLERLSEGRTVFTIAHRLSTIRNADLIAVMNDGYIIESGTHEQLMNKNGAYTRLVEMQQLNK